MELEVLGEDRQEPNLGDNTEAECLTSLLMAATIIQLSFFVSKMILADQRLPRSFKQEFQDSDWAVAIDREFNALV